MSRTIRKNGPNRIRRMRVFLGYNGNECVIDAIPTNARDGHAVTSSGHEYGWARRITLRKWKRACKQSLHNEGDCPSEPRTNGMFSATH